MKTTLLFIIASFLGLLTAQAQQPNPPAPGGSWNPYLIQGFVTPAPMLPAEFNGTGQLIFDVGNTGSDPIVWVTNQEMLITISLSFGKPNVPNPDNALDAINAIGGPGAAFFTWEYFPATRTFRATQAADLPANWRETVTIDYKVVENSFSGAAFQNGFNSNISPPGYTNPQPTDDDTVAAYTFVEAFDYGDAPASYGVASHEVNFRKSIGIYRSYVYLGNAVDPEAAMQNSTGATGDDTNQSAGLAVDDEDGVVFPTMTPGTTVQIPVAITLVDYDEFVTSSIRLFGYVDWNKNGIFDNTERFTTFSLTDYLAFDAPDAPVASFTGPRTFAIDIPLNIPANATGEYFTRFRIGSNIGATGAATYGEVEDHTFQIAIPLGSITGTVTEDLTGNGSGDTPIGGVLISLLDGVGDPVLDGLGDPVTTLTDPSGNYSFSDLPSGNYSIQETDPSGYTSVTPNLVSVVLPPGGNVVVNFVDARPKAATFAEYLADNASLFNLDDNVPVGVPAVDPLTGLPNAGVTDTNSDDQAGLGDNVDGDVYNNLQEYALCFDPGSGAKVFPNGVRNTGLSLQLNGSSLDATFNRPAVVTDVTYELQSSTDGQIWSTLTTISPVVSAGPVPGSSTVSYPNVIPEVGGAGFLRLEVSAGSGLGETVSVTGPVGWQIATVDDFCQTYADPLLEPCLVTGLIDSATPATRVLDLSQASGTQSFTTVLEAGKNYYLEVMSGDQAGHVFDIESFTGSSVTLAADSDLCALSAPYSTQLTVPLDLAGDMFVIRKHKTLEGLFPIDDADTGGTVEGFAFGSNLTDAGVLLRFDRNTGTMQSYTANSILGGSDSWVASATGPGAPDNVLPPGEGIFVHNLLGSASFDILQYGEVRTTQLAVPLKEGYNFVAAAHPVVTQSIDSGGTTSRLMNADGTGGKFVFEGSGARSLADQVQFWQDDNAVDAASTHICYDMIFYLRNSTGSVDQWSVGGTAVPTNEEGELLFEPTRSAMYCIQTGDLLNYYIPSPISNTVN